MKTLKLVTIIGLIGLSSTAFAAKKGGYLDIGLGLASQTCAVCGQDVDAGIGGKIAVGYRFNEFVSLEAGFGGGQGSWTINGDKFDESTNTFFGAVVGTYPISKEFEVLGRIGVGSAKSTTSTNNVNYNSGNTTVTVFGAGIGYTPIGTNLSWRLEYNQLSDDHSLEGNGMGADGIDLLSIGAVIMF